MSRVVPILAPFTGGLNTRERAEMLPPNQSPGPMENVIFAADVVQERNGYPAVGVDDPLSGTATGASLTSVRRVELDIAAGDGRWILTDADGKIGVMDDASAAVAFTHPVGAADPKVVEDYAGEVLIVDRAPEDGAVAGGQNPILRFAGLTGAVVTGTGTYTVAVGAKRAAGVGTNFNPNVPAGSYLNSMLRVTKLGSDTELGLYNETDIAVGAAAPDPRKYGFIGLRTLVTDKGAVSYTSGSGVITGKGTTWASGVDFIQAGDTILPTTITGNNFANRLVVTSVVSDTSCNVTEVGTVNHADANVGFTRFACGNIVCAHDNRLWIAGVPWAKDNLYLTPAGYDMGQQFNGAYSSLTDAFRATQLFSQYVPSPSASGEITALCSTRLGLLVGRSGALYTVRGQYPNLNVSLLHPFGCFGPESMLSVDDGIFVANEQGIWQVTGGAPIELTADRRYEYQAGTSPQSPPKLGAARGLLFAAGITTPDECWVYDLRGKRWLGNWKTDAGGNPLIQNAGFFHSARIGREADACYFVANQRVGDIAPAASLAADGETATTTNRGRFVATLPPSAFGAPTQLKTITGLKVGYVMDAATGSATVSASADDAAYTAETPTLAANSAVQGNETPQTVRIYPTSGQLGVRGRSHRVKIERSASATNLYRFAISAIEANVRSHGVRQ